MASKCVKKDGSAPTEVEQSVVRALKDLQCSKDLREDIADLYIVGAKEVAVSCGKKAIVVFVPHKFHRRYKKVQSRIIREMEKKFSGSHVCIVAQRTIYSKNYTRKNKGQLRPRSRTLTAVHEAVLEDIVYP